MPISDALAATTLKVIADHPDAPDARSMVVRKLGLTDSAARQRLTKIGDLGLITDQSDGGRGWTRVALTDEGRDLLTRFPPGTVASPAPKVKAAKVKAATKPKTTPKVNTATHAKAQTEVRALQRQLKAAQELAAERQAQLDAIAADRETLINGTRRAADVMQAAKDEVRAYRSTLTDIAAACLDDGQPQPSPADMAPNAVLDLVRETIGGRVAVCPDCGPVTRCDEDRCCMGCGLDLIVCADQGSADEIKYLLDTRDIPSTFGELSALCAAMGLEPTPLDETLTLAGNREQARQQRKDETSALRRRLLNEWRRYNGLLASLRDMLGVTDDDDILGRVGRLQEEVQDIRANATPDADRLQALRAMVPAMLRARLRGGLASGVLEAVLAVVTDGQADVQSAK